MHSHLLIHYSVPNCFCFSVIQFTKLWSLPLPSLLDSWIAKSCFAYKLLHLRGDSPKLKSFHPNLSWFANTCSNKQVKLNCYGKQAQGWYDLIFENFIHKTRKTHLALFNAQPFYAFNTPSKFTIDSIALNFPKFGANLHQNNVGETTQVLANHHVGIAKKKRKGKERNFIEISSRSSTGALTGYTVTWASQCWFLTCYVVIYGSNKVGKLMLCL